MPPIFRVPLACIALSFCPMAALSEPIALQPGQTSFLFMGNIQDPVRFGGPADYLASDGNGNVIFRGNATLPAALDGQPYTISIEALNSDGTLIDLFLTFPTIRFTSANSFEGGQLSPLDPAIGALAGYFDSSDLGDIGVYGVFRVQASQIPEPTSSALALLSLSTLVLLSYFNSSRKSRQQLVVRDEA